uniref:GST C-terminal domain-containing protein n=1 Tax=Peronospora matthiolae TaxID=2874970 RepID=A0AAV1UJS6_9STRA
MTSKDTWAVLKKGMFVRDASKFRNWIEPSTDAEFPAAPDRYHLYVSLACPWAHRCLATLYVKGLQDIIGLSVVHPVFQRTRVHDPTDQHTGWAFVDPKTTPSLPGPSGLGHYSSEGAIPDTVNSAQYVRDLYEMCSEGNTRYTVPVLWDKVKHTIVSNESADIIRMLNSSFDAIVPSDVDLFPLEVRDDINAINEWIYNDINNGVYKCGFSATQSAYDDAVANLFRSLDRVEAILANQRFLVGQTFTEADLRLFTTLIRFDEVYYVHFKTNKKMIAEYPNLLNYTREIYQFPPVTKSVSMQHIKFHYYGSHTHLNAFGIVPAGPNVDYSVKHDRNRFTGATLPEFPATSK